MPARVALLIALLAYVAAAVMALFINRPGMVEALKAPELKKYAENHWDDEGWDQQTAIYLTDYLASLRNGNESTSKKLTKARGDLEAPVGHDRYPPPSRRSGTVTTNGHPRSAGRGSADQVASRARWVS
jgi:hypothetical protein